MHIIRQFSFASPWFNKHEYMVASLAKLQASVSLNKNIRSLMKKLNKTGLNKDPCGMSLRISR